MKLKKARKHWKGFIQAAKLAYANETFCSPKPMPPLYNGPELLHLIKQNCLLKTFLRTLLLMNQVSLYLLSLLELIWERCLVFSVFQFWFWRTFLHTGWCFQHMCDESWLLEGHIHCSCILECWEVVYGWKPTTLLAFFLWLVKSLKSL